MKYKTTPYRRGYNFEMRTKRHLEKEGYLVWRNPKSKFPDLIAIMPPTEEYGLEVIFVECKVGKYLSKEEKLKAQGFIKLGFPFMVAYRDGRKLKFKEV